MPSSPGSAGPAEHLRDHARRKVDKGHGGAVTLIQCFGSAANLYIHLHCLAPAVRRAGDGRVIGFDEIT